MILPNALRGIIP
jgi:hypothetical protein